LYAKLFYNVKKPIKVNKKIEIMKKILHRIVFNEYGKIKELEEFYKRMEIKVSRQTISAALNGRSSSELAMKIRRQALNMGAKEAK